MNTLLRALNTLLLVGIFCVLILIFRHIREPISVEEVKSVDGPIVVQGQKQSGFDDTGLGPAVRVEIVR